MIKASDISLNLSGGATNTNPNLSLGGNPSAYEITSVMQNLFNNVTQENAASGYTDYRCFYVFNNNATDTLFSSSVYFDNVLDSAPQLQLGLFLADDVQRMVISQDVISGTLTLRYGDSTYYYTSAISWGGSYLQFRTNMETALNALSSLSGVQILASAGGSFFTFEIAFTGDDGNKYQPTLAVSANNLSTGSGTATVAIQKIVDGGPINTIPDTLANATTAPVNTTFYNTSDAERKAVGTLRPNEGFPVWVKRTVPPDANPSAASGSTFKLVGGSLPS